MRYIYPVDTTSRVDQQIDTNDRVSYSSQSGSLRPRGLVTRFVEVDRSRVVGLSAQLVHEKKTLLF